MRSDRIFPAPSLSAVLKQLMLYRSNGLLTIRSVADPLQPEVLLAVEYGRPTRIFWNRQEEEVNEINLAWFNQWGEIVFTFQSFEPLLQLPAPGQSSGEPITPASTTRTVTPASRSQTRPLPRVSVPRRTGPLRPIDPPAKSPHESVIPTNRENPDSNAQELLPAPAALILPVLTPNGRAHKANRIPRYDRVVFLLINGKRNLTDLALLTKRHPGEIFLSLQRLQDNQLVRVEVLPERI